MTIDEAIEQFKYDAECNRADLDLSYAEDNEQIAKWLEELKVYQQHEIICNKGYNVGYNKAIDDFVEAIDRADREEPLILDMYEIEQMAEQLKAGGEDD